MKYENFKITMSTGIDMIKRGFEQKVVGEYLVSRGVNVNEKLLDNFVAESDNSIINEDSIFPPDLATINAIELSVKSGDTSKE